VRENVSLETNSTKIPTWKEKYLKFGQYTTKKSRAVSIQISPFTKVESLKSSSSLFYFEGSCCCRRKQSLLHQTVSPSSDQRASFGGVLWPLQRPSSDYDLPFAVFTKIQPQCNLSALYKRSSKQMWVPSTLLPIVYVFLLLLLLIMMKSLYAIYLWGIGRYYKTKQIANPVRFINQFCHDESTFFPRTVHIYIARVLAPPHLHRCITISIPFKSLVVHHQTSH